MFICDRCKESESGEPTDIINLQYYDDNKRRVVKTKVYLCEDCVKDRFKEDEMSLGKEDEEEDYDQDEEWWIE